MTCGTWALAGALLATFAVPGAMAQGSPPQILVGTWQGRVAIEARTTLRFTSSARDPVELTLVGNDLRGVLKVLADDGRRVDRKLELSRTSD